MTMSKVFQTQRGRLVPPATVKNRAGGPAYQFSDEQALIQKAVTCTFNGTFYATAEDHLNEVVELCSRLSPDFIARVAVYSRKFGYMKDMPAYLVADLAAKVKQLSMKAQDAWGVYRKAVADNLDLSEIARVRDVANREQDELDKAVRLFRSAFKATMGNGIMVKKFAHVLRSGVTGRKSFGSTMKRTIQDWLNWRSPDRLFRDSVGGDVTLADLIKLARPKATDAERSALYRYLIGKEVDEFGNLPELVVKYELFKMGETDEVPDVEFRHLTGLERLKDQAEGRRVWTEIARNAPWHRTRMNLNTFVRHGVFDDPVMVDMVAARLADPDEVRKANVMPYQLLAAYLATRQNGKLPRKIQGALHDALEVACENVPTFEGQVYVCVDISGSMTWTPVTGQRDGRKARHGYGWGTERYDSSSKIMCVQAAALVASAILRKNPDAKVIPYDDRTYESRLDPRDTVMTNADKLASYDGGGTNCSLPLRELNYAKARGDLVIYISDYESWVDWRSGRRGTAMAEQWAAFKGRNPDAKLVCIDLAPRGNCQVPDDSFGVLNVGGFSDKVFDVVQAHVDDRLSAGHVVDIVKGLDLPDPVFRPWTQGRPGNGGGGKPKGGNGVTRGKWFESGDGRRARAYAREKGVRLHRLWSGNTWRALYAGTKLPKDIQRRVDTGSMKLKLIEV